MAPFKKLSIRDMLDQVEPDERPQIGDQETSANFDMDRVLPFLESLHVLGDITTPIGRLAFVADMMKDIPIGETRSFEIVGRSRSAMHLLTIEAFMDDIDAPDLRFIGTPEMIGLIDAKLAELDDTL